MTEKVPVEGAGTWAPNLHQTPGQRLPPGLPAGGSESAPHSGSRRGRRHYAVGTRPGGTTAPARGAGVSLLWLFRVTR